MNNIILVFVIIVLIVFFIYKLNINSEHFDTTEPKLSQSGIMLVKYKLAIMSADTLTNYFTNYNTTPNDNIYKNWLDSYLTFSTEQKKTLSPFRNSKPGNDSDTIIPINDVILEIIRTGKLTNYSDELRNIIICTYLAALDVLDKTDIVYVYKLNNSIPCNSNCDITLNKNYNINIKVSNYGEVDNVKPKYILDLIQSEDKYKSLSQTTKDIFNNSFNDLFKHLITNSPDDWGITVPYFISSTDLSNFKYLCARMLIIYSEEASSLDTINYGTTLIYKFNCDSCVQIYCNNNKDKLNSLALLDASFKLNGGKLKSRNLCKVGDFYYEYAPPDDPFCFIGSSLVLMADYTTKEIKDVKIDDMVISAKTGLPQKILLIDVPPITSCELYGLNEFEPFATTNHPFISNDNKLLVVDTKSAINISKHDSNIVKEIKINDIVLSFDEKIKPITVENINIKKYNDIQLYNIITEDHTFFVNNFGVHDNSFNYECYKTESLRIGLMVLLSKDIINDFTFEELFNKYHQEVMNMPLNMDDYYEYFNQVVELCHTQKCLDFLYYLWCNKFDLY